MTQTEVKQSNSLKHIINTTWKGHPMKIVISLDDECKNGHQDFSVTGSIWTKGKPLTDKYFQMGGCCHEEILQAKPSLKKFVRLHGCDYKGIPTHAAANGYYHLRTGFNNTKIDSPNFKGEYCEYYRVTPEQFEKLNDCKNELQFSLALQNLGILAQWEAEAKEAIAELEEMTGTKFIVDSVRTQYVAPTPEQIKIEEERQATGYYTEEAEQQRAEAAKTVELDKLKASRDKKINEANTEFDILSQVLKIGGKAALNNCLYYNHSKEIGLNWKEYGDQISASMIEKLKTEIILPEGVKFK